MSKTVTSDFTDIWNKKTGKKGLIRVQYKRRYWTGAAYSYEANWTTININDIERIGSIAWKLDTPFMNNIKSSNVAIYLNNSNLKWLPNNITTGLFTADTVATSGYEPYLMKFRVQVGFILHDNTEEYLSLFTGLATDYVYTSKKGSVEIMITGMEHLLKTSDAQLVSTVFTNESTSPASGNSITTDFITTSDGIGRITGVRVNTTSQIQGTEYKISGLNEYGTGASIEFTTAPVSGAAVDVSGRKWYTDMAVESLTALLCDQANITDRTIDAVVFPGGVSGTKTIDIQADWDAGTVKTNINTSVTSGSIVCDWYLIDNFTDGNTNTNPAWTSEGAGSASASTGAYVVSSGNAGIYKSNSNNIGSWRVSLNLGTYGDTSDHSYFFLLNSGTWLGSNSYGYALQRTWIIDLTTQMDLLRMDNGIATTLGSYAYGAINSPGGDWILSRESDGTFKAYGIISSDTVTAFITVTSTSYTTFPYIELAGKVVTNTVTCDDLYYSRWPNNTGNTITTGDTWESAVQDIGYTPTAWGQLERTEVLNGGTISYYTASSTDGASFTGYTATSAGGIIQSALYRYFKVRAVLSNTETAWPELQKLIANFSTTQVNVSLANFSGKTCFDAIQRLAQMADYEWGFDGNGAFFFRSKTVSGSPDFTINQATAIAEITNLRMGYDSVINAGQVTYKDYYNEYNSSSLPETAPSSETRFGTHIQQDDLSDILLANDVNLGAARAQLLHDNNYLPKYVYKLKCKMFPQADLADIVRISFYKNPLEAEHIWGDPLRLWGEEDTAFGVNQNVLARDVDCKVIGINYNPDNWTTDLELQEIL